MNSTIAERRNLPIRELLAAESRGGAMTFRARWQTAVKPVSGHTLQKLRLALARSVSELLLTSANGSNAMITISLFCVLLICLFRLDLDDAAIQR